MGEVLLQALMLVHKTMTFEFQGVLLDESIDDSNVV